VKLNMMQGIELKSFTTLRGKNIGPLILTGMIVDEDVEIVQIVEHCRAVPTGKDEDVVRVAVWQVRDSGAGSWMQTRDDITGEKGEWGSGEMEGKGRGDEGERRGGRTTTRGEMMNERGEAWGGEREEEEGERRNEATKQEGRGEGGEKGGHRKGQAGEGCQEDRKQRRGRMREVRHGRRGEAIRGRREVTHLLSRC